MRVYLTGEKEKANPQHHMFVCPARVLNANDTPTAWKEDDGAPRTFDIVFRYGMAVVDEKLGAWLLKTKQASPTPVAIQRVGAGLLGALARVSGHGPRTQY